MNLRNPRFDWSDPIALAEKEDPELVFEWIRRAIRGDVVAQEAIFYHCVGAIRQELKRRMNNRCPDDIEDLVQKSLISLLTQLESFEGRRVDGQKAKLKNYAVGIARFTAFQYFRKDKTKKECFLEPEQAENLLPQDEAEQLEERCERIMRASMQFEEVCRLLEVADWSAGEGAFPEINVLERQCLELYFAQKRSMEDWAERASLSFEQAKRVLLGLREKVHDVLKGHEIWPEYKPNDVAYLEEEYRLLGRVLIRLCPELRVRNPRKFKLSKREHLVYELHFMKGYSPVEIMEALNITRRNVDQLIYQARTKARRAKAYLESEWA